MRIVVDPRQRIAEYGESSLERRAVLPKVRGGLLWVPRKSRRHHTKAYHPTIRLPDGLTPRLSCAARTRTRSRRGPPAHRQLQPVVRWRAAHATPPLHRLRSGRQPRKWGTRLRPLEPVLGVPTPGLALESSPRTTPRFQRIRPMRRSSCRAGTFLGESHRGTASPRISSPCLRRQNSVSPNVGKTPHHNDRRPRTVSTGPRSD